MMQDASLLRLDRFRLGESLNSYLARLARLNDYNPPSILSELILNSLDIQNRIRDRINLPSHPATYKRLTILTKQKLPLLYTSTPHRFAFVLVPPNTTIPSKNISGKSVSLLPYGIASKQLRPAGSAQFCPLCLKASSYHRLVWTPIAVSACLEHNCLLFTSCSYCGKDVSVHDITTTECSTCGGNLTEANTFSLTDDTFGLSFQYFIQQCFMSNTISKNTLPQHPPKVLYRIIDGLAQAIVTLGNLNWSYLHSVRATALENVPEQDRQTLTPYESYCLYTTACKALIDWPHGFYEFLQAYRTQRIGSQTIHAGPKTDLGTLYTQWLQDYWQHPAFSFVQEAFEEYFANHYWLSSSVARTKLYQKNPYIAGEFGFINIAEAARITGRTTNQIELLIKTGRLAYHNAESNNRLKFVNKTELLEVCHNWSEGISRSEVAEWLGVTEKMVTAMVTIGLLQAEHDTATGFPRWLFSKSAVITLLETLSKHVLYFTQEEATCDLFVNLIEASRLVFVIGLDATGILQRVAEGKLHAYNKMPSELRLGSLFFHRHDLEKCIEDIKTENGWMSREEVTKLLGIKDGTLARWVKGGLLPLSATYASAQYFSKSTVEHFINEHVTSDAAAQILSIGVLTVQKWAREGRLSEACVSGPNVDGHHSYLFHKEKLIQWRQERLTFGEAVELLGVSKSTLHRWAEEKKIEPLDAMGGKQRWFSRQAIVELAEIQRTH